MSEFIPCRRDQALRALPVDSAKINVFSRLPLFLRHVLDRLAGHGADAVRR